MHADKIARGDKTSVRQICTKGQFFMKRLLLEDEFAQRVNFARVTVLHEDTVPNSKKTKKKKHKKLLIEGKGWG